MKNELEPNLDLTIRNLTKKNNSIIVNIHIPEIPFNMCIYGKSSSGKTNVILNLLGYYKRFFKTRTIIFTLSRDNSLYDLEDTYGAILLNNLLNDEGNNVIENLISHQKSLKANGEKLKHYLIIFDDFICDRSFSKRRSIYDLLYSQARHYNISVITTSQQVSLLPASIRRLSWYDICFAVSNTAEKNMYINENCNSVNQTEKEFLKTFNDYTAEPYSFIYIDKWRNKFSKRFGK